VPERVDTVVIERKPSLLFGVGDDAEYIARQIAGARSS
jgi:hypothetical protein